MPQFYFVRLRRIIPGVVGKNEMVINAEDEASVAEHAALAISNLIDADGKPMTLDRSDIESVRLISRETADDLFRKWLSGAST